MRLDGKNDLIFGDLQYVLRGDDVMVFLFFQCSEYLLAFEGLTSHKLFRVLAGELFERRFYFQMAYRWAYVVQA